MGRREGGEKKKEIFITLNGFNRLAVAACADPFPSQNIHTKASTAKQIISRDNKTTT